MRAANSIVKLFKRHYTSLRIYLDQNLEKIYRRAGRSALKETRVAGSMPERCGPEVRGVTLLDTNTPINYLVSTLLAEFAQVPFDHEAARQAARIRIELETHGMTMIAGTAASRNAVLVTHNIKEFSRVKNL